MSLRIVLIPLYLLISLACLGGGYGVAGQWVAAGLVLVPIIAASFYRRFPAAWLPSACLVGLVCLAAAGLLVGAPTVLMFLGATAGLAAWDLMNLDRVMESGSSSNTASRFEKMHALSLTLALGIGLLMAGSGELFSLRLPFVLLILLILLDLLSLDRVSRYLGRRNARS
jgi:hypothetical protein